LETENSEKQLKTKANFITKAGRIISIRVM
jgi:hypothetical protein